MHNRNKGFVRCDKSPEGNHTHLVFRDIGSCPGGNFPLVFFPASSLGDSISAKCCKVGCSRRLFWYRIDPWFVQPPPYRFCSCAPWRTHVRNIDGPVTLIRNDLKRRNFTHAVVVQCTQHERRRPTGMRFAQSERTLPGDFEGLPITLFFQLRSYIIGNFHHFILHVENSPRQNKLDANRLGNSDRVGKTWCCSTRDHVNMMSASSDVLPNAVKRLFFLGFICHRL